MDLKLSLSCCSPHCSDCNSSQGIQTPRTFSGLHFLSPPQGTVQGSTAQMVAQGPCMEQIMPGELRLSLGHPHGKQPGQHVACTSCSLHSMWPLLEAWARCSLGVCGLQTFTSGTALSSDKLTFEFCVHFPMLLSPSLGQEP